MVFLMAGHSVGPWVALTVDLMAAAMAEHWADKTAVRMAGRSAVLMVVQMVG